MDFIRRHSKDYNFIADLRNGITIRWGKSFNENPYKAPIPELVDISISNHCSKNCSFCYRKSIPNNSFMSVEDYKFILESLNDKRWGNIFQVALGGGEPLEHPNIVELLQVTREFRIIPNFTTNAIYITKEIASNIKLFVGAVAISFQNIQEIQISKAHLFFEQNIKTNIHYLLSRNSIKQGIEILEGKYNNLLEGYNSIIFLTFKPTGRGTKDLCIELNDDLKNFCRLIDHNRCALKIGFDSCFMPMLMHFTKTTIDFIEPCECAFFSAYIDENLNVKPCSFSNYDRDIFNLRENSFYDIWNNYWNKFRKEQVNTCERECKNKYNCKGGCPYYSVLNLCKTSKQEKSLA
jgi:radical SAM protein with 4Fe4S-binding SPASM domain